MARAYYQLFCVYFLRFPKARASIILYSTFQVLVVVGVCNQLIWYLDSNILKPATVVRVFFRFFFKLVTIHRVLIASILKAPKKSKLRKSFKLTSRPLKGPKFSTFYLVCNLSRGRNFAKFWVEVLDVLSSSRLLPCKRGACVFL